MRKFAVLAVLVVTTCCVGPPARTPPPAPRPSPAPSPPPPPPVAVGPDWRDWALTPGNWTYRHDGATTVALFGVAGQPAEFVMRCEGRGELILGRAIMPGTPASAMTIMSTEGATTRTAMINAAGTAAEIRLPARDTILDAMAFSRGRFMITMTGAPRLIAPAWPEVARVIEDCR